MCQELILSWQDTKTDQWFPIGRFSKHNDAYTFIYTKGAKQAKKHGFIELASMPDFNAEYRYSDIFPLLKNRILNKSRPDRQEFLKWLNIDSSNTDFEELAKTGGVKATDNLCLFPMPIKKNNQYNLEFFTQGIGHLTKSSQKRIEALEVGEKLLTCLTLMLKDSFDKLNNFLKSLAKYLGQYPAISTGSLVLNIDAFLSCEFSKSAQKNNFSPTSNASILF
jgi:hypothetical protein